jgi:hypothetical protein
LNNIIVLEVKVKIHEAESIDRRVVEIPFAFLSVVGNRHAIFLSEPEFTELKNFQNMNGNKRQYANVGVAIYCAKHIMLQIVQHGVVKHYGCYSVNTTNSENSGSDNRHVQLEVCVAAKPVVYIHIKSPVRCSHILRRRRQEKKFRFVHFIRNILLLTPSGLPFGHSANGTSCAHRANSCLHFCAYCLNPDGQDERIYRIKTNNPKQRRLYE